MAHGFRSLVHNQQPHNKDIMKEWYGGKKTIISVAKKQRMPTKEIFVQRQIPSDSSHLTLHTS